MQYRRFYEKELEIALEKDFDVHHIDFDRENNNILNLVAIPKKIHKEYHCYKNKGKHIGLMINFNNLPNHGDIFHPNFKEICLFLLKYEEIYNEIKKYIIIRDKKLFKKYGVHKIKEMNINYHIEVTHKKHSKNV